MKAFYLCERRRINNLKKREPMEISVPSAYAADPVFTHEDSRVGVVEEIACEMGKLRKDVRCHLGVSLGGNQHSQSRRLKQN